MLAFFYGLLENTYSGTKETSCSMATFQVIGTLLQLLLCDVCSLGALPSAILMLSKMDTFIANNPSKFHNIHYARLFIRYSLTFVCIFMIFTFHQRILEGIYFGIVIFLAGTLLANSTSWIAIFWPSSLVPEPERSFILQYMSLMSHEFRSLLASIQCSTELLEQLVSQSEDKEIIRAIETIDSACLVMKENVEDILLIAKIQSDKESTFRDSMFFVKLENVNIRECAHKVVSILTQYARNFPKRVTVELEIDNQIPSVVEMMQSSRLGQVLLNLGTNAIKYSTQVKLKISKTENTLVFEVIDNGPGISDETAKSLFVPFAKFHYAEAGYNISSSGLGLTVCKMILLQAKGSIDFTSKLGEGTNFRVQVPFKLVSKQPQPLEPSHEKPVEIIIAEDGLLFRKLLSNQLRKKGFLVTEVSDGKALVEAFEHHFFPIVLSDVEMPFMNGIEASKLLRGKYKNSLRIIILTGRDYNSDPILQHLVATNIVNLVLQKPVKINELIAHLIK